MPIKPTKVPATLCATIPGMILLLVGQAADFAHTSRASERLAPVVDLVREVGTNTPVSKATAKALGLSDEELPTIQLTLLPPSETHFRAFAVSARNSNDLIIAHLDKKSLVGTIWLTSRGGTIRVTVSATNSTRQVVPNDRHAAEFESHVKFFVELSAATSWDNFPFPLHTATKHGEGSEVAKILRRDPKSINARDLEGMTPLAYAIVQERADVTEFLLDKGADPTIANNNGLTPLDHACGRNKDVAMPLVKLLLAKGADVNATNSKHSALSWATSSDNTELVKLLLDAGADAKLKTDVGDTVLHSAADRGGTQIASMLIAHGADVNAKITGGTTPLHNAARAGREEVLKLLLARGAEVNARRHDGATPLVCAADREHKGCVEILLDAKADINAADDNGDTALHRAISRGNLDVAKALLTRGAKSDLENKQGQTPLKIAREPVLIELLRRSGAEE